MEDGGVETGEHEGDQLQAEEDIAIEPDWLLVEEKGSADGHDDETDVRPWHHAGLHVGYGHAPQRDVQETQIPQQGTATGSRDIWVEKLRAADIVSAPINTLLEASNDPDVLANGYVTEIEYPKLRQAG